MSDEVLDVFLSYRRTDKRIARKLYKALTQRGLKVWVDLNELRAGEIWSDEIGRQIRRCRVFLPLITSNFKADSFMAQEISIAMREQVNRIETDRWFCPVYYRIQSIEFANKSMRDFVETRQILHMPRWGIRHTADRIAALCSEDMLSLVNVASLENAAQRYIASSYYASDYELISKRHYTYGWNIEFELPRRLVIDFKVQVREDKWFNAKEWMPFSRKGEFQLVFTESGTYAVGSFEKGAVQKLSLDFEEGDEKMLKLRLGREFIVPEEFCGSGQRVYRDLNVYGPRTSDPVEIYNPVTF